jgi:hypothetical protein
LDIQSGRMKVKRGDNGDEKDDKGTKGHDDDAKTQGKSGKTSEIRFRKRYTRCKSYEGKRTKEERQTEKERKM